MRRPWTAASCTGRWTISARPTSSSSVYLDESIRRFQVVYPAAGLIDYYEGSKLVLINKSPTAMDARADLVLSGPIGEILGAIQVR